MFNKVSIQSHEDENFIFHTCEFNHALSLVRMLETSPSCPVVERIIPLLSSEIALASAIISSTSASDKNPSISNTRGETFCKNNNITLINIYYISEVFGHFLTRKKIA